MRSKLLALIAGVTALALSGCFEQDNVNGPDTGEGVQSDDQAIGTLMTDGDDYFGTTESMSDDPVTVENTEGKTSAEGAPIESFYFARILTGRDIRRDIHIEDPEDGPPVATVSTVENLRGIFRLFYDDPNHVYLPGIINKRLHATARYNAQFVKRERHPDLRWRGWRLIKVSGAEVVSEPTTKDIVSLEIESESVDQVITDPLELVSVRELPTFQPGERVTLRVTTTDESDYVFLHVGRQLRDDFRPVGGGVFEATWTIGERRGHRWVAVDVIDRETLFDDEAPYDSVIWVLHFRVAGEIMPEFVDDTLE